MSNRTRFLNIATLLVACGVLSSTLQAESSLEFNRDIRPILAEHCFACHGVDSAAREADLRLDRREDAVECGAIVPGDAEGSEFISRVLSDDPDLLMPPPAIKKPLSEEQKELLARWISDGAAYEDHWSFIAPERPESPEVDQPTWARGAIDRFILKRLEEHGLAPAPEADSRALFRRLHFDITGLPPKPADVEAFVVDYERLKDDALSNWIDKLMESTAWGEHRARYWLDAARYADTHGLHYDNYREMWPYRDWVVRAFNNNQPFDNFAVEQIAGDLLHNPDTDQLVATGFQRCNITTNEGGTIDEENLANYAADRVQTFGWVFLGLTTNCAQCHDHKFDPFTTRDYYALAAFFRNTKSPAKDGNSKDGKGPVLQVPTEEDRPRWEALPKEIATAKASRDSRRKLAEEALNVWASDFSPASLHEDLSQDGLVVHLPLDEGNGQVARNMAGSPEQVNASGPIEWLPNGKLGPAPRIRPGSTYDLGQRADFEIDQPFSYGMWFKTDNVDRTAAMLARMDDQAKYRGWDLWQQGESLAVHLIDTWDVNAIKVVTNDAVVQPDQWQHVLVTYDGSARPDGVEIYIDGKLRPHRVERNTLKAGASIRTDTPLRVGQRRQSSFFDGGSVQDVRVYERVLSEEEIRTIATTVDLEVALQKEAAEWTPDERRMLLDYFLLSEDQEYEALTAADIELEAERAAIQERSPITHIQQEKPNSQPMANILMRGAYDRPGEQVSAATPAALHPMPTDAPNNRLGLATWVFDPANPLTARVTVNRFWQEVFGQGLVPTAEDFGVSGALPSHPELLDWLAIEFREGDWDVKHLFKLMLMSSTYRQAAVATPDKREADPDNVLLSRGPRYRMDAEMVRDSALAVSGLLSPRMYGPGTKPYQPDDIWNIVGLPGGDTRDYRQDTGENLYRRTIYTFWKRMAPPPNLEAFNAPSREVCTVCRERTNTPLQALVTLNDPQSVEAARRLAETAIAENGDDDQVADCITLRVLGRTLDEVERGIISKTFEAFHTHYQSNPKDAKALISVGDMEFDKEIEPAPLAAWTMVCSQVMNLDESLNK